MAVNVTPGSFVSNLGAYDQYTEGATPVLALGSPPGWLNVRCYVDEILVPRLPGPSKIKAQMSVRGSSVKIPMEFVRVQPFVSSQNRTGRPKSGTGRRQSIARDLQSQETGRREFVPGRTGGCLHRSIAESWPRRASRCLTGCTVGPKYVRPSVVVPPAYKEARAQNGQFGIWKTSQPRDQASRGDWWAAFNDPQLNDLEAGAEQVESEYCGGRGRGTRVARPDPGSPIAVFPTVTAGAGIANQHLSTFGPEQASATYSDFSLPVQASWEPDLWGRVRNTVKANSYAAQASVADLENVRLAAQAELATDYFELRAQDELKRVLDATVSAYREALDLTRNLCDAGLGPDEAVAQAESQWKAAAGAGFDLGILARPV